jgi:predicted metal-dependent enzyme (double-stranded beta helix superfamily)
MCDLGHAQHASQHYGFLVDCPELRAIVERARQVAAQWTDPADRVEALKPWFAELLAAEGWLPDAFAQPSEESRMGGGIGQYALYRAEDGSLTVFSLVVPVGAETPVHDHLAWGIVGIYRGRQDETVYRRLDDGSDTAHAELEIAARQTLSPGECYTLVPPANDIHFVRTTSDVPSVSIHLLANDTACIWRHAYDPATGRVTPFRSGYANAPCPDEHSEPASGSR